MSAFSASILTNYFIVLALFTTRLMATAYSRDRLLSLRNASANKYRSWAYVGAAVVRGPPLQPSTGGSQCDVIGQPPPRTGGEIPVIIGQRTVFTNNQQLHYARLSASQSAALRLDEHTEMSMTMPPSPATEMMNRFCVLVFRRFVQRRQHYLCPAALTLVVLFVDQLFRFRLLFKGTRIGTQSTDGPISTMPASQRRKSRRPVLASTALTELPKAMSSGTITANRTVSNSHTNHSDLLSCYVVNAREEES